MIIIFEIIFTVILCELLAIYLVKVTSHLSYQEAKQKCFAIQKEFIQALFSDQSATNQVMYFPLCIGFNDGEFIQAELEHCFCDLEKYFEKFYFDYYSLNPDNSIICYQFRIFPKSDYQDPTFLLDLLEFKAQSICKKYLHSNCMDYSAQKLCAVKMEYTSFTMYFALNSNALPHMKYIRKFERKRIQEK